MSKCDNCGKVGKTRVSGKFSGRYCSNCYQSYVRSAVIWPLPAFGEVKTDNEGKYICHLCGRSFKKVLSHSVQMHNVSASEYKEMFGLYSSKGLCSVDTVERLRESVKDNFGVVVKKNLIKGGVRTRFRNGSSGRTLMREQLKKALSTFWGRKK